MTVCCFASCEDSGSVQQVLTQVLTADSVLGCATLGCATLVEGWKRFSLVDFSEANRFNECTHWNCRFLSIRGSICIYVAYLGATGAESARLVDMLCRYGTFSTSKRPFDGTFGFG